MNKKIDSNFEQFINELSTLFKVSITKENINEFICNSDNCKSKIYNSKIDVSSLIFYVFNTFFINENKVTSSDKVKNFLDVERSSLSKKAKKIPVTFFTNLREKLFTLCQKFFYKKGNKFNKKIIASDGTSSIDHNFEVSLNMSFYDATNDLPLNLSFEGHENRNKDVKLSVEYIKNHLSEFKNCILILDAFYYDVNLINFLISQKIHFLINGRQNSNNYDPNKPLGKMSNERKILYDKARKHVKVTSYNKITEKKINVNKKKEKYNKTFFIEISNTVNLISFLPSSYTDEKIIHLYKERWVIETFFGIMKNNFNYKESISKTKEEQKIRNECVLIMTYIIKTIKKFALLKTTKKSTDKKKVNINETKMFKTFKDYYLRNLILGNFNFNNVLSFVKKYCPAIMTTKNRYNDRRAKTPHSKWNARSCANSSEINLILKCMDMKTIDLLDKNKKLMVNRITILKTVINNG